MKTFLVRIFLIVLYFSHIHVVNGQTEKQNIIINATDLRMTKDSICFLLSITNASPNKIVIFKPDIEYVNYGLIAIGLINQDNSAKFYFDHGQNGDIDNIFLKEEDYIVLGSEECYIKQLKCAISEFIPRIKKGTYKVEFMMDYSIVNFTFPCEMKASVFKGKSITEFVKKITL